MDTWTTHDKLHRRQPYFPAADRLPRSGGGGQAHQGEGRRRPVRLTTNEWYRAQQLGDTYWLYVVWDPLDAPDPRPLMIRNPAHRLDHAKQEAALSRYCDLPAAAIEQAAREQEEECA